MLKRISASFLVPNVIAVILILLKVNEMVLVDPLLIKGKDGVSFAPYDDYGPRNIDVAYGLVIIGLFGLSILLPLLMLRRRRKAKIIHNPLNGNY